MKVENNSKKIESVLTRGVEQILPDKEGLKELMRKRKIKVYLGIDPTGKLHLGHLAGLRKLRQFQNLGHDTIVLIGGFTAMIGDPTGKIATRKMLTREQVLASAKDYKKQIRKILDFKKANVRFLNNEEWTQKLKPIDLLGIASKFTVARLLERDMFQKRIKEGKEIYLHEFIYPIFQAYDSITMSVDLEIGGSDQIFNMLRGRDLMKKKKNKEKFVLALKLLTDPSGKKMGKTEENLIPLDEKPQEMFGKIMSWPDSLLEIGFELLADVSQKEIKKLLADPKNAKIRLTKEVIQTLHSEKAAERAEREFERIFKEKKLPTKIPELKIKEKTLNIPDLLVKTKLASSKSEAKRLILQRGIKIDGKIESDWQKVIEIKKGQVVQVGKRKFIRLSN